MTSPLCVYASVSFFSRVPSLWGCYMVAPMTVEHPSLSVLCSTETQKVQYSLAPGLCCPIPLPLLPRSPKNRLVALLPEVIRFTFLPRLALCSALSGTTTPHSQHAFLMAQLSPQFHINSLIPDLSSISIHVSAITPNPWHSRQGSLSLSPLGTAFLTGACLIGQTQPPSPLPSS